MSRPAPAPTARRRLIAASIVAASALAMLAGCSMGIHESASTDPGSGGMIEPAQPPAADGDEAARTDDGADADADRSVVTTGWMSVTVDDPVEAAETAGRAAVDAGGRIDQRQETPGGATQAARAQLTLRIPADRFDGVVDELRELGTVTSVSIEASDVTRQRADLDARVEALRASIDRLRALLGQAQSTADLIEIESELTSRQAELDGLVAQRDALVDEVEYSTLTVELVTVATAPTPPPASFVDGLAAGWQALVTFGSGLLVVVGALLPWIAALAVISAIVVGIIVLATRARRGRRTGAGTPEASAAAAERPEPRA